MAESLLLQNTSIVVTRPAEQNQAICQQLTDLGATSIAFPCIEIQTNPAFDPNAIEKQLSKSQALIFISSNAVRQIFLLLPNFKQIINDSCLIFAVGAATADCLRDHGITQVLCSKQSADSEALLKLPELQQVAEKLILIIKGEGGRDLIYESLTSQGAIVSNVEVYQRKLPELIDITPITHKIDLILFTSSETVSNFLTLTPDSLQKSLLACQSVVGHPRIAEKVSALGFEKLPIIAATPTDADMLDAVLQWARQTK